MATLTKEKRRFFRHPIHVPIRLRVAETDAYLPSHSADISLGGLNFSWSKKLAKGTLLDITIPVKEKLFDIRARVVYSKEEHESARYRTGVSFVDFPSAFKAKLAEEVLQILEYRKSMSRESGHDVSEEEAAKKWVNEFADHFGRLN
jgi:c-di-GMP-binding flagellar brake protein YcgR